MDKIIILFLVFTVTAGSCKTKQVLVTEPPAATTEPAVDPEPAVNFSEQSTWLLGYINHFQMTRFPHSEWYRDEFNNYRADDEVVNKLKAISTDDLSILIVLGTWCPDSRREVPRFMRIMESWGFPESRLEFIGVDNTKIAPVGDYEKLNIERVPTFIVSKNNIEIGRIIENPVTSLEQDMLNILTGDQK
ncbi:MAG: thioredoxin family protein [Bacteroidales bacterium]|nr:thioredoxin family protein [Bacteroidales bacterium]